MTNNKTMRGYIQILLKTVQEAANFQFQLKSLTANGAVLHEDVVWITVRS